MNNRNKKQQKCTDEKPTELEQIRMAMRYDKRSFALLLERPYRTVQDWLYGISPTPADILKTAKELQQRDKQLIRRIIRNITRDIARRYPTGIPSEREQ